MKNNPLLNVLLETAALEGTEESTKEQILALVENLQKTIAILTEAGYPVDDIDLITDELEDGSVDLVFCLDGFEIPLDMSYEKFLEYKKNMEVLGGANEPL